MSAGTLAEFPPAGVETATLGAPDPAGAVAVMVVSDTTVKGTLVLPNRTFVAPVKSAPPIVTVFPPPVGPAAGTSPVIVGLCL